MLIQGTLNSKQLIILDSHRRDINIKNILHSYRTVDISCLNRIYENRVVFNAKKANGSVALKKIL